LAMFQPFGLDFRHNKVMKKMMIFPVFIVLGLAAYSQKVDSIFFHLYTDSLKKGRHNYINVDGKLSNGKWLPLTSKEIQFSSSVGEFEGNDLVLPANMKEEKVTVKAVLKNNPAIWKEKTIWIKKLPEPDRLPTNDEILKNSSRRKNLQ
jgi:hypothetical protein